MELGMPELLIILVIIVLLWGPGRLAKIGGELGNGIRSFREGLTTDKESLTTDKEPEKEPEKDTTEDKTKES